MRTDPKVLRLTRARTAAVLGAGAVLLAGVSACGSSSQTTSPATGVKKEAGTLSVNLRIISQYDAPSDAVGVKICGRAAFTPADSCKDKQDLLFGQVADMSAPKVVGTLFNLGDAAYVDFEAINPPVGAPYMTFKANPWDDEPVSTIGLSEGESTTVDFGGSPANQLVVTRDADISGYKMLRVEIRAGRAPSSSGNPNAPGAGPSDQGSSSGGGTPPPSAPVDPETAKAQLLAYMETVRQLIAQSDDSQSLDAQRLQALQAEADRLAAAQAAAEEAGLAAIDKANTDLVIQLTAGAIEALGSAGIQVPSDGSLTPAQRAAVLGSLAQKEQAFVGMVKQDLQGVRVPASPAAQAARDEYDQEKAAAQAQADQLKEQAAQLQAQLKAQTP